MENLKLKEGKTKLNEVLDNLKDYIVTLNVVGNGLVMGNTLMFPTYSTAYVNGNLLYSFESRWATVNHVIHVGANELERYVLHREMNNMHLVFQYELRPMGAWEGLHKLAKEE